ncbi:hypothetical protein [Bermanella sp. R86510]|uniref:hypothetical protein n=1 Tax=Bermanella sp. R86510 TaxID=3093852 RepID=UPI0037C96121
MGWATWCHHFCGRYLGQLIFAKQEKITKSIVNEITHNTIAIIQMAVTIQAADKYNEVITFSVIKDA